MIAVTQRPFTDHLKRTTFRALRDRPSYVVSARRAQSAPTPLAPAQRRHPEQRHEPRDGVDRRIRDKTNPHRPQWKHDHPAPVAAQSIKRQPNTPIHDGSSIGAILLILLHGHE